MKAVTLVLSHVTAFQYSSVQQGSTRVSKFDLYYQQGITFRIVDISIHQRLLSKMMPGQVF